MSVTPASELLTEAAGVKIYMTEDRTCTGKICVTLKNVNELTALGKSYGFHLTKSKWDPYPWINYIDTGSLADTAGLRPGDCLIGIDEKDLAGLTLKEIASLIHGYRTRNINLFVWRYDNEDGPEEATGIAVRGPLPEVASKLANAVSGIVRVLECPVCLESSMPPVAQCVHGHIICFGCRPRTPRCPICRVRLGQGRCLLADKLHKIFRDVFDTRKENLHNSNSNNNNYNNNDEKCPKRNLRDWLFGKQRKDVMAERIGSRRSKPHQLLLSKLFRGGLEKAASADNLATVPDGTSMGGDKNDRANLLFVDRLNLHDRTKSASAGELSQERRDSIVGNRLKIDTRNTITLSSTSSSMSNVSLTPAWGGSMESVSLCTRLTCPLSKQSGCEDIITQDTLLEHLSESHGSTQVHFYSTRVKLLVPHPFGPQALYVLHSGEDLFFFQCEQETIWISGTIRGKAVWDWSLYGQGQNGTEIKVRRRVASLVNPLVLSLEHTAPLPRALLLHTLDIQLIECCTPEHLTL